MASPTVVATATGDSGATNISSHPITLPTGTGKVIVLFACDGGTGSEPVTSSPGWSRKDYQANGTNVHGSVFESSSDSPGTLTIQTVIPGSSTAQVEQSSHVSYRISGGGTVSVVGSGAPSSTTPDPAALAPAGGSADYLWLTGLAVDANPTTSNTITAPTGYATAVQRAATGANGAFAAMTHRAATAASENPGTWTLGAAEQHAVFTIAVAPGAAAPSAVTPGVALRITGPDNSNTIGNNHFNLGLGFRTDGSDSPYGSGHTDITPGQIAAGYEHPTYFVYKLNADGKPCVELSAPLNGGRTSENTDYARAELREFRQNDTTRADWDPKSSVHWIEGWSRVTAMTVTDKKSVVVAQAHSAEDDTIMILTTHKSSGTGMELKLRFNGSPTGLPVLDTNYAVGREFYWRIELNGGQARVFYFCPSTGAGSTTSPIATTSAFSGVAAGWYFKCGSYNQTNLSTDPGGGTIKVQLRDLRHFHTGWTQPQVPYSTDVGSGGTGNPTVEVGANATGTAGDVFTRTATETNAAAITGRSWQILSGPAGSGQIIGNGATLNWTPTTVGDYTIGYTAAYAGGSATDTFTVTVAAVDTPDPDIPAGTPVWPSTFLDGTPYPVIGSGSTIINVSTASQFQTALTNAAPGHRIRLASGTYSGQFTASSKRGTATNGVSVEAATLGGAVFASGSTLRLTDCAHWTIVGLDVPYDAMNGTDTISIRGNGEFIHLRDNVIGPPVRNTNETVAGNFLFVGDDVRHVRIDGNEFRNKGTSGNCVRVYGNFTTFEGCQYVRIDHNLFRDIGPEVGNDKEPVRLGVSTMSRTQGNHVVERNVFLRCQSEPEVFSGKMGRIRCTGNVFKDCTGGPVLRHGIGCVMADNYIIDTANSTGSLGTRSGGPRFYDSDHYIGHNTIQGTRGTGFQAALLLDTGDAEGTSTNLSAHWRVIRATVEKNWITDCATGIQVGDNYTSAPLNCVVTDNLVSNTANTTAVAFAGGITAGQIGTVSGNLYAATPDAHGAAQDQNGIWRKAGYGSRVTYLLSTDVGPSGNVDADADGTGNGTGTTGGGGGGTPDAPPTVEVGAAASVTTGTVFTRSATEAGANIALREWTIAQAPAGATGSEAAGTSIGTSLTLSWPAPATLGTYVLRYTAANAAGVDSADLTVTVTAGAFVPVGSPPDFVSAAGAPASGLQSIVDPDPPPGVQPGDFQICAIQIAGSETITVVPPDWFAFPGGGTVTSPSTPVDRGGVSTALMFYNTTGATDAVWEKSGTRLFQAVRAAWRGHTSVGEMKVTLEASGTGSRNHVTPPVQPVRGNSRVVAVAMSDLISFSAGPWQAPAGWTPRYDKTISGGGVAAGLEYESITIADALYEGSVVTVPGGGTGGGDTGDGEGGIFLTNSEIQDAPTGGASGITSSDSRYSLGMSTPNLLARSNLIALTGIRTTQFGEASPTADRTYDARTGTFEGYFDADAIYPTGRTNGVNTTALTGYYVDVRNGQQWKGRFCNQAYLTAGGAIGSMINVDTDAHYINQRPIRIGNTTPATFPAIIGGKVVGKQPVTLTWQDMKYTSYIQSLLDGGYTNTAAQAEIIDNANQDGDARFHIAASSTGIVDGLRVKNGHDGFGMYGDGSRTSAGQVYMRNCWFTDIHDDGIENDEQRSLHVFDCLIENTYTFLSTRADDTTGTPQTGKTQVVEDSIVTFKAWPGPFAATTATTGHDLLYKMQTNSPYLQWKNVILAPVKFRDPSGSGPQLPTRSGDTYENVTICWLGTGTYPGNVPAGCTLQTGATAQATVINAVATWKARHGVIDFDNVNMTKMLAPESSTAYTTALTTADLAIPAVDFSGGGGTTRPVIRSSSVAAAQNAPTVAVAKPSGLAVGDLMLAFCESDSDGDLTSMTAAGWSNIGSSAGSAATDLPFCKIFRKVAVASDVAAATFAFPDNAAANMAVVLVAIVAGTFDPTTATTTPVWATDAAPSNGQVIAPSVTGVVDGLLLTTHMAETQGTNRSWSSGPAGMTLVNSVRVSETSYVLDGVWSQPLTSTAATGTRTATCSGTPAGYAAAAVIVNPATGSVTPTSAAIAYMAGVMYAKLGTASYKTKVDTALAALPVASTSSLVPLARQLPGYLIAADLTGYHDSTFEGFAALVRSKAVAGGLYGSLTETGRKSPNYQGALSLAARTAASAYLDDRTDLDECATIFRRWTGQDRAGWSLWEPTADHDDSWVDAANVAPGWPAVTGNVFVAPSPLGNDANSGLTDSAPKLTIAAAINAATAGQTVLVAAGTYTGDVSTPKGGTAGNLIRVRSEDLGGARIVGGVTLAHQWVTLEGFDVDGGGIVVTADNVQVLNNEVHGTGSGQTRGVGGVAAPAGAILTTTDTTSTLSITTSGTVGSPRVYDGQGHTVGKIDIAADYVTVQNFRVRLANNSGIYSIGTGNTIQNNDIARVREAGTGDINAITFFGSDTKILYNDIGTTDFVVEGDPGGSHTDGIQTWNTPSKRSSSNVTIQHNRIVGPGQSDDRYIHQGVMAEGKDSTDGGGGGTGTSANWLIADNYFDTYGNQCIKVDDIDSVAITRNTFAGSCTKIVERGSLSVGTTYYSDNVVTGSFGSVGVTATAGPGPQGVGGGGGAGIRVDSADGLHSAMTGVVLDGNTIYSTGTGIYVSTPVTASTARNNLVFGTGDAGLYAADAARGWLWVNNTVARCGRGIITASQFVVRNNIGYNNAGGNFLLVGTGVTLANNLASGTGGGSGITGVSVADPLFVNPSTAITTANYRLQAGSPAIGGATSTDLPPTDIVGVPRPQPAIGSTGTGDVGCYEMPAPSTLMAGVNGPSAGAIAGAIAEDMGVGPAAPAVNESALSQAWEALGAAMITAKLLERAGYGAAFTWGSSAIRRAAEFLASKTPTSGAIPPTPTALQWVPYAVNNVYGTSLSPLGSNSARGNSVASADWIF